MLPPEREESGSPQVTSIAVNSRDHIGKNTRSLSRVTFPQKCPVHKHTQFDILHPLSRLSSGNRFHSKHSKRLIDFIHSDRFFPLFKFAHKAKSEARTDRKFFLR